MRSRAMQPIVARLVLPLSMLALLLVGGCFNPNGGVTGYFAYISTPMAPKTVVIYDMRSGEPFFVQEIPVGKQLNFRFLPDIFSCLPQLALTTRPKFDVVPKG